MYKYYDNLENKKITISKDGIECDYLFPKGYFITPNGYLYNTSKANGHRYNSFVNEYEYFVNLLEKDMRLPDFSSYIKYDKEQMELIKKLDIVDYKKLIVWAYSTYEFPGNISLDINNENKINLNQKELTELYKGFIDASTEFYDFFVNNFNDKPLQKYNEINQILGNVNVYDKMVEILVRCMNFHKIELHGNKNITTSSLHPVTDFYDYLINDYDVWVVPKIVYNDGFREIDIINSIPISSYKAIERYEDENPDRGKVKILGL